MKPVGTRTAFCGLFLFPAMLAQPVQFDESMQHGETLLRNAKYQPAYEVFQKTCGAAMESPAHRLRCLGDNGPPPERPAG
jgi:hypothetical protein